MWRVFDCIDSGIDTDSGTDKAIPQVMFSSLNTSEDSQIPLQTECDLHHAPGQT